MKKLHCILFLFLSAFVSISAQKQAKDTVVTRNVTVEREYVPVVKNAGKVTLAPQTVEPKDIKTEAVYTEFNLPLPVEASIHTLPAARLSLSDRNAKKGFARIGIGSYPNALADFAYPLVNNADALLDFTLRHRGTFGYELYSKTAANLQFDKKFDALNFFTGITGGHDYFRYYGKQFDAETLENRANQDSISDTNTFLKTGIYAGILSAEEPYEWHYRAKAGYDLFNIANTVSENTIGITGGLSGAYDDDRIGGDIELYNMVYTVNPNTTNLWNNYAVLMLNPYYDLQRSDNWSLRLGFKAAFSFLHGNTVNPLPDIRFNWNIVPEWVDFYGGLTGDYKVNTINTIFAENPYLSLDMQVADTYTPFEFYGGFNIKPFDNMMVNVFANFRYIDNQYFFVNKEQFFSTPPAALPEDSIFSNRFDVIYTKATHFKAGIRANYNYQNRLNIQFKGAYNGWDMYNGDAYAWNKPVWEADFNANFNVTKELAFSLNAFYEGERYAKLGDSIRTMSPKIDVNLGASYTYLDWLTFFAKANNLLNNRYEKFYGYQVQGLNVMVGAAMSF